MPTRPSWQGQLKLSLVTCPVMLISATSPGSDVRFHMLNPKTNNRIKMITTDAETGDELERADLVKGYEAEKGKYIVVTSKELEAVKLESTRTLEIERFAPADQIDRLYWDRPYFLVPDGKAAIEAYTVIREAMEASGQVALGRVVMSTRERLMALEPRGRGILATSLRAYTEVRDVDAAFSEIPNAKPDKEMIAIAQKIIDQKAAEFEPKLFVDHYEDALRDLIAAKMKGKKVTPAAVAKRERAAPDLMEALRESLGQAAPRRARAAAARAPRKAAVKRRTPSGRSRAGR